MKEALFFVTFLPMVTAVIITSVYNIWLKIRRKRLC